MFTKGWYLIIMYCGLNFTLHDGGSGMHECKSLHASYHKCYVVIAADKLCELSNGCIHC